MLARWEHPEGSGSADGGKTSIGRAVRSIGLFVSSNSSVAARRDSHGTVQRTSEEMTALSKFFRENGLYTWCAGTLLHQSAAVH